MLLVLKRIVPEIKDENNFETFFFCLVKILQTSDQFNITMFENMYVKHKSSNLGHK